MLRRIPVSACVATAFLLTVPLLGGFWWSSAWAGGNNLFRNNSVGGVAIDTQGLLTQATVAARQSLKRELERALDQAPGALNETTELRKVSLRGLEQAIADALKNNLGELPDEVLYLAGLQRVQYILVYPEQQDIVLAGPGEGWTVNQDGEIVGKTTGRPVIHLDDLLVALRTVNTARQGGISCSIDPTPEGRFALEAYLKRQKRFSPAVIAGIEQSLGTQQISITGVPENSHFARVMVAADYRMKQIAMKLTPSPLAGLPSFLDMMKSARAVKGNVMPRWWLACNYESLARSDDGLAWQLRGPGVKVLTEDDFIAADGSVEQAGQRNPMAEQWASKMTEAYDELSTRDAVFGQLRNLMDMCVVAALIEKEGLFARAGLSAPLLTHADSNMMIDTMWNPPKTVATQASYVKRGRDYIITASGGVQIESWQVAAKAEVSERVAETRQQTPHAAGPGWWWN